MKEATLRDFFLGAADPGRLAVEARDAVEPVGGNQRRIHIEDLPPGEEFMITAPLNWDPTPANVRMFRDWLTGSLRPPSEPELSIDTLSGLGFLSRTRKVHVRPGADDARPAPRER